MIALPSNAICLIFDHDAEYAARFYAATLPNSSVFEVVDALGDYASGNAGDVLVVDFTVGDVRCLGIMQVAAFQAPRRAFSNLLPRMTRTRFLHSGDRIGVSYIHQNHNCLFESYLQASKRTGRPHVRQRFRQSSVRQLRSTT